MTSSRRCRKSCPNSSGRLADGVRGRRSEAGLGLEARVRPIRAGADHADSHHYLQPAISASREASRFRLSSIWPSVALTAARTNA
ncbi:hypothetical protein F7725_008994 [Dissostichus mawsoni]|uniref:Uncharacterized protein n=1 Tax=Dissostichus mawsoni TaxID=36200 RepID=A0A7J5Z5V3_DISMA|nr:hypothetical protein F7725_008994 [Dissostichus mawsoni]